MQLDVSTKPLAARALSLATEHHAGIERKFTGEPYIKHPIRVAEIIVGVGIVNQEVIAAALLHDCLEDENARGFVMPDSQIDANCNARVLRWVRLLTNTETGNRAQRKAAASKRIAAAPAEVRCIKLADIIDNCTGVTDHDPDFAEIYLREKRQMCAHILTTGVPSSLLSPFTTLRHRALDTIANEMNKLAMFALENGQTLEAERKADEALIQQILAEEERSVFADVAMF